MARTNKSRHAVLALLSLGPRSGYDIERSIRHTIGHFWTESYGQIYPALRGLVADGMATVRTIPQDGRPDRKVYTITPAGSDALRTWLETPPAAPPVRNEMLLKLFVGWQAPYETQIAQVRGLAEHFSRELDRYEAIEAMLRAHTDENPDAVYWLITLRSGQLYTKARLQWCEETLTLLAELEAREPGRRSNFNARTQRMARLMELATDAAQAGKVVP